MFFLFDITISQKYLQNHCLNECNKAFKKFFERICFIEDHYKNAPPMDKDCIENCIETDFIPCLTEKGCFNGTVDHCDTYQCSCTSKCGFMTACKAHERTLVENWVQSCYSHCPPGPDDCVLEKCGDEILACFGDESNGIVTQCGQFLTRYSNNECNGEWANKKQDETGECLNALTDNVINHSCGYTNPAPCKVAMKKLRNCYKSSGCLNYKLYNETKPTTLLQQNNQRKKSKGFWFLNPRLNINKNKRFNVRWGHSRW